MYAHFLLLKTKFRLSKSAIAKIVWLLTFQFGWFPVGTRCCGDTGFLLDLHCDIDGLRIEIEVTSLYYIFFQHHGDVVAIPIFNVVWISDKDEINNGKHVVLFHLSKYFDKLYGNTVYKI